MNLALYLLLLVAARLLAGHVAKPAAESGSSGSSCSSSRNSSESSSGGSSSRASGLQPLTSQFIGELCLPTTVTAKTSSTHFRFAGMADDPMLLDAFVQGEAAFERAVSMGGSSMPAPLWNDPLYTGE